MDRDPTAYVGIVNHSESVVTHVTAQVLRAATQARCGVARTTRGNLRAASFVTCPPVRRNIPGFSVLRPPPAAAPDLGGCCMGWCIQGAQHALWGDFSPDMPPILRGNLT